MDKEQKYLEIWKRSRESVEHFDKILLELRKTLVTINGISLPILGSLFLSSLPDKKFYFSLLCLALNIVDIVFWFVEKHYHIYLLVSAKVANNAEENLGLPEEMKLTQYLANKKLQVPFAKGVLSFYDLIYLLPAILSISIAFLNPVFTLKIIFGILLLIEIGFGIYILKKNFAVEELI